jgi:thiol-disulfide isomerase/thioredoxin
MLLQWLSISMILLAFRSILHCHHHRTIWNRQSTNIPLYRYYSVNALQWQTTSTSTTFHHRRKHNVPSSYSVPVTQTMKNRYGLNTNDLRLHRSLNHEPTRRRMSVSGVIYDVENDNNDHDTTIVVTLFTKEGCTLCDKVQDILQSLRSKYPHKLIAVDITDPIHKEQWYERYKYDIPVLHVNPNTYWAKHRITLEQAEQCFQEIQNGLPITSIGTEPNAVHSRPKGSHSSNNSNDS